MNESQPTMTEPDRRARKAERKRRRREQAEHVPHEPPIAFVHIPKTAGGTLKSVFIDAFGRDAQHNSGNYLKSPERAAETFPLNPWIRVTIGHLPYGLLRENLPAETRYVTFLREPIDRVVSHYYRHFDGGKAGTLEEALERGMPDVTNLMTRFLCGHTDILGALPESALDDAKVSLEGFAFVGFQERFDESLLLLQDTLGMPRIAYGTNRHVNDDRPSVEALGDEKRELIARYNQFDVDLYSWARSRFDAELEARADDLAGAVEALREESTAKAAEETERVALAAEWLRVALPPGTSRPIEDLAAEAEAAGFTRPELNRARRQLKPDCRNLFTDGGLHWLMRASGEDAEAVMGESNPDHRARKKDRKRKARRAPAEDGVGGSESGPAEQDSPADG